MIFSSLFQYSSFFTQYQILDALRPKSGGVLGNQLQKSSNLSFRTFSEYDIDLTWGLYGAGKMMGIPLVDHIIITDKSHYSFADNGRLCDKEP